MLWDDVQNELKKKLTKAEYRELEVMIKEYGSLEDVIIGLIRKEVNPDLVSMSEIELCMQKALKIGAYVTAINTGGNGYNSSLPYQIARDVALQAEGGSSQDENSRNPFQALMKQMSDAISNAIMTEITNKLKSAFPMLNQLNSNSSGNDNGDIGGSISSPPEENSDDSLESSAGKNKKNDNNDVFTGDE